MAYLVTILSAHKPVDLFYVLNEPKLMETTDAYLACNGCSAEYLPVSKDADKAKCILKNVFTKLKFKIPTLDKPSGPLSMVIFLEQLIARDLISTADVSLADRRKIKSRVGDTEISDPTVEQANSTTVGNPTSPGFDSSFDDEAIQEIARLERSKNALDQVIAYGPVLEALKQVNAKLDSQFKLTSSISEEVKVLQHDVKEIKEVQVQQAATLDQLKAGLEVGSADNSRSRNALCIFCAADYHRSETCIWRLMKCNECGELGHSKEVHRVTDPIMKERVREFHGKRKFNFM